jgi:hypothetical protein
MSVSLGATFRPALHQKARSVPDRIMPTRRRIRHLAGPALTLVLLAACSSAPTDGGTTTAMFVGADISALERIE